MIKKLQLLPTAKLAKCLFASIAMLTVTPEACSQVNYDNSQIRRETLNRGVVAVRKDAGSVVVSWRYLQSDSENVAFNVYRNGTRLNKKPLSGATCFVDDNNPGTEKSEYVVKAVVKGKEINPDKIKAKTASTPGEQINNNEFKIAANGSYTLAANSPVGYLEIPLDKPADGVTPAGHSYSYTPNDASIGDVDGDGNYEIILKWDPTNSKDNAHDGYTGNVIIDCYKLTGERMWRIDLGHNVRAGAHYTQFMVFDFDGDGKAEVIMKTADGSKDSKGKIIGDPNADYRETGDASKTRTHDMRPILKTDSVKHTEEWKGKYITPLHQGRILTGPEYLTVFSGETGEALYTTEYTPQRGDSQGWGDPRANRSDRFLAAVAYLDGVKPSVVMCRGYYTRTTLAAYDWDGKELKQRWFFDSNTPGNEGYAGQGNHNLRVGDIDGDGCDEIVYGSCVFNNDGTGLYTTGMGHGDAMHLTCFDPSTNVMQVWNCHENRKDGSSFKDAATGKVLWQIPSNDDVGRAMAADIDPTSPGLEMWSSASGGLRNFRGETINESPKKLSTNMAVWWTGDLLRELLDKNMVGKYDHTVGECKTIATFEGCLSNNGTKANPCLQGDILGDWREEVLMRTEDNNALRLYISTDDTEYRFHTFLHDPVYRISIATQNVAYNQPTQTGFYFGPDLIKKGNKFRGWKF